MENKPRQFWIEDRHEKDKPITKPYKKYVSSNIFSGLVGDEDYPECEIIHVIEYAAYESLLAIIKRQHDKKSYLESVEHLRQFAKLLIQSEDDIQKADAITMLDQLESIEITVEENCL